MNSKLFELIEILENEVTILKGLAGLVKREEGLVVNLSIDALKKSNEEKENLSAGMRELEVKRTGLIEAIASKIGEKTDDLNLKRLCSIIPGPASFRLKSLHEEMLRLTDVIREGNSKNQFLFKSSLEFVNRALNFFYHLVYSQPTYGKRTMIKSGFRVQGSGFRVQG